MTNKRIVEVDFYDYHRARSAIAAMQGKTFYCEDDEGVLRRWYPPEPIRKHRPEQERT